MLTMFQLEKLLIPPGKWNYFYATMPDECQKYAASLENCGIGHGKDIGWFVLDNENGTTLVWAEKEELWNKVEHLY